MFAVLQVYCLLFGVIALFMLPQGIINLFKQRSFEALSDLTFTCLTLTACAIIVGLLQLETTGIL